MVGIDGKSYKASILIWFYMTGKWPSLLIDHRDQNKQNDRWENLYHVTRSVNNFNKGASPSSNSGYCGVYRRKDSRKWWVNIRVDGKLLHLGSYVDFDEAVRVRRLAEKKYYPEVAGGPSPIWL